MLLNKENNKSVEGSGKLTYNHKILQSFFIYSYYLQQLHAKAVNSVMKVKAIYNQNTNTRMHIEHFRTGVLDRYIEYKVL